jgi:hypothetical protein
VSATKQGAFDATSRQTRWHLDRLAMGQTQILTLRLRSQKLGEVENLVTVNADGGYQIRLEARLLVEQQ